MLLDFEKPIAELEQKLHEMKQLALDNNVNMDDAVQNLEQRIQDLKKYTFANLTRWQRVQLSRHGNRPYTLDYISYITDSFVELHGDRNFGDDKAIVGGLATISGKPVVIIGQQKGRNTKDRQYRRFGMANPEGYRKALRLMKLAEKFNKPVVLFIDTPGAYPGIEAEERGQAEAIARNLKEMTMLKVPIVGFIIGEGASGGALGLGVTDKLFMLENTWYSVISPESCSSILWKSWDYKEQAAEALRLTAQDMLEEGLIDDIIKEPLGGAHRDYETMSNTIKARVLEELASLEKLSARQRVLQRVEKFGNMGVYAENS